MRVKRARMTYDYARDHEHELSAEYLYASTRRFAESPTPTTPSVDVAVTSRCSEHCLETTVDRHVVRDGTAADATTSTTDYSR